MQKLDKKALNPVSPNPSEDFSYTWLDLYTHETGFYHPTAANALKEANENYSSFGGGLKERKVLIIKAIEWANKP